MADEQGVTKPLSAQRPPNIAEGDTAIFNAGAQSLNAPAGSPGAFNVYRYPADLATDEHPHYVMFFMTLRESDISDNEVEAAKINGETANFDQSQSNRVSATTEAALGTRALTNGSFATGGGASGDTPGVDRTARYLAAGAATTSLLKKTGLKRDQVLLKEAIALYLSDKPSTSYKAAWQDEDLGIVGAALSTNKGDLNIGSMIAGGSQAYILQNADAGIGKQAAGAFQVAAGQAPNPFKAQLFKSMGFRTFSFNYIFLPKDHTEYQQAKAIIQAFKLYMHPKFDGSKFMLNYPAEFNIVYYHKQQRNEELFRIANCALTDMSIEYGGNDFATFRDNPGVPTEIAMKLTFTELEVLSRERIQAGF